MIIRKKTIYLVSLIIMLVVVGYINHQLSKESVVDSSIDYQNYEEELTKINNPDMDLVEVTDENDELLEESANINEEGIEVVDSIQTEINDLATEANSNIDSTITNKKNIEKSNYFVEYRLSRDKMRANLIDRLNNIVDNEKTSQSVRDSAQKEIIKIGRLTEKELYMEGLIKSKGFEDSLVFLSDENARVVVDSQELTQQEVMQILEIVTAETDLEISKIKIIEKDS